MKFIVFYLQSINSLEGPGMFFSSAAIIRRLRKYTATHTKCQFSFQRGKKFGNMQNFSQIGGRCIETENGAWIYNTWSVQHIYAIQKNKSKNF